MHPILVSVQHYNRLYYEKSQDNRGFGIRWKNDKWLTDLDITDDIVLVTEEDQVCQQMTTNLKIYSAESGLYISQEKTKIIRTGHTPV